jgi:electron transfer flavoprotein alpha subunit
MLADYSPSHYQRVVSSLVQEHKPRMVLFGDTSSGSEIAGTLSSLLLLPLVSSCRSLDVHQESIRFTSQICGGRILVEGDLPGTTILVTMIPGAYKAEQGKSEQPPVVIWMTTPELEGLGVTFKGYIEPEVSDVDITKEDILVGVGRGIQNQDNLQLMEELAGALKGVVCASRPVVDQGWLPVSRLVGKSGKQVKPKLYLALGISGAPEHVEAITDSEVVIAINTDPAAPIFNYAAYGSTVDLLDLVPALIEKVSQSKLVKA